MKKSLLIIFILINISNLTFSQQSKIINENGIQLLLKIPYKEGKIVYEKIYNFDSINNFNKIFNAAKSALINNTSYKYSKIDEDRISGNITTEINYTITNKAAIRFNIPSKSRLSIDVKENRFRIRIFNSQGTLSALGESMPVSHEQFYEGEMQALKNGKKNWKEHTSYALMWDLKMRLILEAFTIIISNGISDDF